MRENKEYGVREETSALELQVRHDKDKQVDPRSVCVSSHKKKDSHCTHTQTTYRKVLRKGVHDASMNLAVPCDNAITRKVFGIHTKLSTSMCLELIHFSKGTWIKEQFQSFSCR